MNPAAAGRTIPEAPVTRIARTESRQDRPTMFPPDRLIRQFRRRGGSAETLYTG